MAKHLRNVILLTGMILGCSAVTEKQCDEAFDHYFQLKMKGVPEVIQKVELTEFEGRRAEFLSQCVGKVKPDVINCWISSRTLDELSNCEKTNPLFR